MLEGEIGWRANRTSFVDLFTRELLDVLDRLRERPDLSSNERRGTTAAPAAC